MSKERLEEIEERVLVDKVYYKYLDGTKGHWGKTYTLSEEDYNYLIERVQELEKQNKRYREALEFYADENNYREQELKGIVPPRSITFKPILHDYGSIARQALEGEE